MKVSPKVTSIERVTALITQMNFLNNIQKRRMVLPFFIAIIALIMGVLVISSISLLIRSHIEFQPLLERARTIMDGTADPTPSEELDGELYFWSWDYERNTYPRTAYIEVSPIKITNIISDSSDRAILTVSFHIIQYRADGERDSCLYCTDNKWYVRKNGNRWIVYKIETKP